MTGSPGGGQAMVSDASHRTALRGPLLAVLCAITAIHLMLGLVDAANPDAWRSGDRAGARQEKIVYLFEGHRPDLRFDHLRPMPPRASMLERAILLGSPGDYALQAGLIRIGGKSLLIAVQVLLTLASILALHAVARALGFGARWALAGAGFYAMLPGNLLQPHVLGAEGLFIPLLPIAAWRRIRWRRSGSWHGLMSAAGTAALASFQRPQICAVIAILGLVALFLLERRSRPLLVAAIAVVLLPASGWTALSMASTGKLSATPTDADMGYHWRHRVRRMNAYIDPAQRYVPGSGESISASLALPYIASHPVAYLRTALVDNVDYLLNPGSVHLVRYTGVLGELPDPQVFKRAKDEGPAAILGALIDWNPGFTLAFVVHTAIWGLFLLLVALGALHWLRAPPLGDPRVALLLAAYVFANLAVIQLAGHSRWSLRQPVEWAFVIAALTGLQAVLSRWRNRAPVPAAADATA